MIRLLQPMPGGLRCLIGYTAQDNAKMVHGKALTIDTSDIAETIVEIMLVYKPTESELLRELREAGLLTADTEITKGQPE